MSFYSDLNRRHKAGLCATLICVGFILLLGGNWDYPDVGIRPVVGVMLLGMAFSWALGSNNRLIHWLFVVFGLLYLVSVALDVFMWPRNKPEIIKDQISIIEGDRDILKNDRSILTLEMDRQEQRKEQEAVSKDSDELFKDERELRRLQTETTFRHVVKNDWGELVGGLLLLSAGLGLILGVKPMRKDPLESPS